MSLGVVRDLYVKVFNLKGENKKEDIGFYIKDNAL